MVKTGGPSEHNQVLLINVSDELDPDVIAELTELLAELIAGGAALG
jgi:hypothetical protein